MQAPGRRGDVSPFGAFDVFGGVRDAPRPLEAAAGVKTDMHLMRSMGMCMYVFTPAAACSGRGASRPPPKTSKAPNGETSPRRPGACMLLDPAPRPPTS